MDQASFVQVPTNATFQTSHTQGHVLCCLCGTAIPPNPAGMCVNCIRTQVDITECIQKQVTLLWCKQCGRYLQPPKHWVSASPESKELLTFCIKRIRGLGKVKLIDASFIWTEPHSMRLKVKLTVQGEVLNGAILQQSFIVEYTVERNMCTTCNRQNANPNSWVGCVQVRQHVHHKRTFFYLEQLILRHGAHDACVNIKEMHEGVDFYFSSRSHALKFIDFLQTVVPIKYRGDKQLVSHNEHTSTYNYKYTFSVEIAPLCKDDLLFLPRSLSSSLGGLGPLVLCTRVTNALTMTDPATLRHAMLDANAFWRTPVRPLMSQKQLVHYIVLDIEPLDGAHTAGGHQRGANKYALADCQVARLADFGANDRTLFARTHLGHILKPGDHAVGYDLANANFSDSNFEEAIHKGLNVPDVILVRKSYEEKRKTRKAKGVGGSRSWKLERMAVEKGDEMGTVGKSSHRGHPQHEEEQDMERFLEELEEDPEMRARVSLYKNKDVLPTQQHMADDDSDEDAQSIPEIPLEELLDDLAAMQIREGDGESAMME